MFFLTFAILFDKELRRNTMPPSTPMSRFMKLWLVAALAVIVINMFLAGCAYNPAPRVVAVRYEKPVINAAMFLYDHIQEVEFAFCGFGRMEGDTLVFERLEMAYIHKADSVSVHSSCPKTALIHGHSHPKVFGAAVCHPSKGDLEYYRQNSQIVGVVICYDSSKPLPYGFVWISKQNVLKGFREMEEREKKENEESKRRVEQRIKEAVEKPKPSPLGGDNALRQIAPPDGTYLVPPTAR